MDDLNNIQELIAEYLSGDISVERIRNLKEIALEKGIEFEELISMYKKMDNFKVMDPSPNMDAKFYAMLEEEKSIISSRNERVEKIKGIILNIFTLPTVPRFAYGIIILLIGVFAGNFLLPNKGYENKLTGMSQEMNEMRQLMVMSMINNKHAVERIKAVGYVDEMEQVNTQIIDVLFQMLNDDENVNVRLVSLESISRHANRPEIRERLIDAIQFQESPMVLIEIAGIMIEFQEKKSIDELRKLLENDNLDKSLKQTIESGIKTLI